MNKHTFSIAREVNPDTKKPFGDKYAGEITVRRPTIADNLDINLRDAASLNRYGTINPEHLGPAAANMSYILTVLDVICEKKPDWLDPTKLYADEDEAAVYAVWAEVDRFLKSFRPKADPENSTEAGQES